MWKNWKSEESKENFSEGIWSWLKFYNGNLQFVASWLAVTDFNSWVTQPVVDVKKQCHLVGL